MKMADSLLLAVLLKVVAIGPGSSVSNGLQVRAKELEERKEQKKICYTIQTR